MYRGAYRLSEKGNDFLSKSLRNQFNSVTILLSHKPQGVHDAAIAGVGLMLSGHTHGGQIWPFDYLVKRNFPYLEGLYKVDNMHLIVSRGAEPGDLVCDFGNRVRLSASLCEMAQKGN